MNQELVNMAFTKKSLKKTYTLEQAIKLLWGENLISVGELTEKAIVNTGKTLIQQSRGKKGYDFNDRSDSKYAQVRHYGTSYASVKFNNKIGTLRVCVFEPKTAKNYFFKIPHRVYAPYQQANDSLKIWFTNDGEPRNPTKNQRPNLWKYQVTRENWSK